MTSYRDSTSYRRSQRLRTDGTPAWPITDADVPSVRTGAQTYPRPLVRRLAGGGK